MKIRTYRIILIIFILFTVGFIVFNSTRTGEQSANISQGVSETIAQIVVPDFDKLKEPTKTETINKVHVNVRNVAHVLEFATLGFFSALLLMTFKFNYGRYLIPSVVTLFTCFTIAVGDEFLQGVVAERASEISDVFMDTLGITISIVCAIATDCLVRRFILKKDNEV